LKRSVLVAEMTRVQSVAEATVVMGHGPCAQWDTIRNPLRISVMSLQSYPVCGIKPAGVRPCEWRNIMSDPAKRTERWKAKYNLQRVKDTLNDIREDMGKRYEAAVDEVCAMESKVIDAEGVSTATFIAIQPPPSSPCNLPTANW